MKFSTTFLKALTLGTAYSFLIVCSYAQSPNSSEPTPTTTSQAEKAHSTLKTTQTPIGQQDESNKESITPQSVTVDTIRIENPIFRALHGAKNGSAYMTVTQTGGTDDKLIGATSNISETVELHDHIEDPNTKSKNMVTISSVDIPGTHKNCNFFTCWFKAKEVPIEFKKGGLHVMFMGIKPEAATMKTVDVNLIFEKSGPVKVTFVHENFAPTSNDTHKNCTCEHSQEEKPQKNSSSFISLNSSQNQTGA